MQARRLRSQQPTLSAVAKAMADRLADEQNDLGDAWRRPYVFSK